MNCIYGALNYEICTSFLAILTMNYQEDPSP